jgi:TonB-linked SusC/RagA family outer membrane protein
MKNRYTIEGLYRSIKTPLLIMKFTVLLSVFCVFHSFAGVKGQAVTLEMKNVEIKKVLNAIEKQGTYRFLFNSRMAELKQKVSATFKDVAISDVLDNLFAGTVISYKKLDNNLIAIRANISAEESNDLTVSGRVTDAGGTPLMGVSIKIKGTSKGTTTNVNGEYVINAPDNAVLVFSFVGFEAQEVAVAGNATVNVTLQASTKIMDEVVVIGYGQASKRDLTGSITKVAGKEVADKPNTNPIASLQGKVAGLSVVNSGTPGQEPDIRIRGTVSIGQVHPLYVVDGIFQDNINYINPNDIESIEILKDPSSLAIFGVKGATGVIAVTTKKAKVGQVVVSFNTSYGFKKLVNKIKLANAAQFDTLFKEENNNNGVATPDYSALTANTDWIDAVTRTGQFSNSNLNVSASTNKNRFNMGVGYTVDQGIIKHEQLQRMMLSLNDEVKLNKAIKIGVNLNAERQHNPYDATWVLDAARKVMPQISAGTKQFRLPNPYNSTDTINVNLYSGLDVALQNSGVINPLLQLENEWDKTISYEYRTVGSAFAEINFLKYLTFRSTVYADISTVNSRQYVPLYYAYDPLTNTPYLYSAKTSVTENDQTWRKFQQDHILTFLKAFGEHHLTAMAGFTTYYFGNFNRGGVAKPYTTGNALPIPNDKRFWYMANEFIDPSNTLANSSQTEYSTVSSLGRILYNYAGKYYLNASLRDDASSQIPGKNRHQEFWAVGAAWEISREDFFKNQDVIDFLKLKASTGVLGNQSTYGYATNYPFYPNLLTGQAAVFGTSFYLASRDAYLVNPDLRWETVNAHEVGIELNGFKNHLHFEANYFNNTTKDLMTYIDLTPIALDPKLENGGSLRNWGEEFSASWNQNLSKDLTLSVAGNISFIQNKIISLSPDLPNPWISNAFENNGSAESRSIIGHPIGSFYGYTVEGIYQSYADILKSPVASSVGSYRPGDLKFKDINKDGVIDANDRSIIGNPSPKFTYGGSVNLTYKGISLGIDVNGVYGNKIFRTWGSLESPFQRVNYSADKIGRWHGPGTSNWVPIISQADRFNYNGSTYNIEDGSYFRLRNIQLGYSLPKKLISQWKMSNLRVFANVQNLKTWKNNLGYTAEYGGSATAFGYDNAGGAIPVVTTFGLSVSF